MTWQEQLSLAVDATFDSMVALRRYLHQNPELSGEEQKTSQYISQLLQSDEVDVRYGVDGRGVIADLRTTSTLPCIALRADIDALPIQDDKKVAYASRCAGVMHACGHDAHAALVYGAFKVVQRLAQQGVLPCEPQVRAIFQPAEETCAGAKEMIEAGAIQGADAILAVHMDPTRRVGKVGLRSGVLTASCDELIVEIVGRGGHAARPHEACDPILAATQLVSQLYLHLPRSVDSKLPVVLSICRLEAGHASNVIPETAKLWGTIRALDRDVREQSIQKFMDVAKSVASLTETQVDIGFGVGVGPVINDTHLTELLQDTIVSTYGPAAVEIIQQPSMGSEDFAFYGSRLPACMMRLGCVSQRVTGGLLHTPQFDVDEEVLRIGARLMAEASIRWLVEQHAKSTTAVDAG